jgi:D-arabinono-1,4-lactone oxidase
MGLYGIVTKVRLQLVPLYNVKGTEITTPPTGPDCPINVFNAPHSSKPLLSQYLKETPYTRFVWWPQKGAERIILWQADRAPASTAAGPAPTPYMQFPNNLLGLAEELLASTFFTLLGNHGVSRILQVLTPSFVQFQTLLKALWAKTIGGLLASLAALIVTLCIAAILFIPVIIFALLPGILHALFPKLMPVFEPMTGDSAPTSFNDYYWRSLPMDNMADDVLLGTEFTEIWVPISYAEHCMNLLQEMFSKGGDAATGYYSTEVYGGAPSSNWMSAAYTDGTDEFKDGVIRFDVYWFRNNEQTPNQKQGFFQQYWDVFLANNIPFRLHWGKFIPAYDFPFWANHYRKMLPHFDDFLAKRKDYDPHNIFFTKYWQCRLLGGPLEY